MYALCSTLMEPRLQHRRWPGGGCVIDVDQQKEVFVMMGVDNRPYSRPCTTSRMIVDIQRQDLGSPYRRKIGRMSERSEGSRWLWEGEQTHTCYLGHRTERHAWGYGCGNCPACDLRRKGWEAYAAAAPTPQKEHACV
jgi:hypothetical protein